MTDRHAFRIPVAGKKSLPLLALMSLVEAEFGLQISKARWDV